MQYFNIFQCSFLFTIYTVRDIGLCCYLKEDKLSNTNQPGIYLGNQLSSNFEYSDIRMKFQFPSHIFEKRFSFMIESTYAHPCVMPIHVISVWRLIVWINFISMRTYYFIVLNCMTFSRWAGGSAGEVNNCVCHNENRISHVSWQTQFIRRLEF